MIQHSYLSNGDVESIEDLYLQYQKDRSSVDYGWQKFFEGFDLAYGKTGISENGKTVSDEMVKEISVLRLINEGYRTRGHLFTRTNPVRARRPYSPNLDISNFGLTESDLDKVFNAGIEIGIGPAKLRDIIAHLEETYCGSIGVEYMYIVYPEEKKWLQDKMESVKNTPHLSIEQKRLTLEKLNEAVAFEHFLHTKYIGQKRFSLEGLETLIPALDAVIEFGSGIGVEEFVIGMAHRGRLNVLANVLKKSYEAIFAEFEGKGFEDAIFEGDVKYHLGYSSDVITSLNKKVRLTLSPNPSHLESVNPVVGGITRAKLDSKYDNNIDRIASILIHGDASIAGQGVVYEYFQMAGLEAHSVGGTIHIVTNNQVGFTTNYLEGRTSIYCTDVAKTTKCPVFHVNGDDVEAIIYTIRLALEYRQRYNKDVVIDLLGYRKYGHNEGDEPRFTQPKLYEAIAKHPNPREIYARKLTEHSSVEAHLVKELEKTFKQQLQKKLDKVREDDDFEHKYFEKSTWKHIRKAELEDFNRPTKTRVTKDSFLKIADTITTLPKDFEAFKKTIKLFKDRKEMIKNNNMDWAMGELMAYATLLKEGFSVRLTGQDTERGTFSHRHAVVTSSSAEHYWCPLDHVDKKQGVFNVYNSLLSEFAVLGYEYGYSLSKPDGLTLWEAQFGDFANGAQVIIDQYIASGETKWKRHSGLVMLLPHGHEGQGPEHSSARLERYLQLCSGTNMQVVNCTTPANFFHVLRRQLKRDFRVPLIAMTPKSLLRHPECVSSIDDFTKMDFQEVIDDSTAVAANVKRVLFCSGKIYYDLLEKKRHLKSENVAIVRLEQLFPLPQDQIAAIAKKYGNAEFVWVQEEPKNMGAWMHLLRYELPFELKVIGRRSSSTPASGHHKTHVSEQDALTTAAITI